MIQIDMQLPKNCLDCPACNEYLMCAIPINGRKWGENDVRDFSQSRPEWCPMKDQEPVKPVQHLMHTVCLRCWKPAVSIPFNCDELGMKVSYTHYSYCEKCLREGLKLLKEQEPVKPTWSLGKAYCGKCGQRLPRKRADKEINYCGYCGREVQWYA